MSLKNFKKCFINKDFKNVSDDINHRHISWSEDGYEIQVSFYQPEASVNYLSGINIETQLDATYSDWLEFNCEYV